MNYTFKITNGTSQNIYAPMFLNPSLMSPAYGTLYQNMFPAATWVAALGPGQKSPNLPFSTNYQVYVGPRFDGNFVTAQATLPAANFDFEADEVNGIYSLTQGTTKPPVGANVSILNNTTGPAAVGIADASGNPLFVLNSQFGWDTGFVSKFQIAVVQTSWMQQNQVFRGQSNGPWVLFDMGQIPTGTKIDITFGNASPDDPGIVVVGPNESAYTFHKSNESVFAAPPSFKSAKAYHAWQIKINSEMTAQDLHSFIRQRIPIMPFELQKIGE